MNKMEPDILDVFYIGLTKWIICYGTKDQLIEETLVICSEQILFLEQNADDRSSPRPCWAEKPEHGGTAVSSKGWERRAEGAPKQTEKERRRGKKKKKCPPLFHHITKHLITRKKRLKCLLYNNPAVGYFFKHCILSCSYFLTTILKPVLV